MILLPSRIRIGEKPKMAAKASEVFEAADHLYNAAFLACHPEYGGADVSCVPPRIWWG